MCSSRCFSCTNSYRLYFLCRKLDERRTTWFPQGHSAGKQRARIRVHAVGDNGHEFNHEGAPPLPSHHVLLPPTNHCVACSFPVGNNRLAFLPNCYLPAAGYQFISPCSRLPIYYYTSISRISLC